ELLREGKAQCGREIFSSPPPLLSRSLCCRPGFARRRRPRSRAPSPRPRKARWKGSWSAPRRTPRPSRSASSPTGRVASRSRPEGRGPGDYTPRAGAAGKGRPGKTAAPVPPGQGAPADLKLRKVKNLAATLTNAEWLISMPGTEEQKKFLLNCTG